MAFNHLQSENSFFCVSFRFTECKINPNQWSRWMGEATFMKQQIEEKISSGVCLYED
jgi:hypothetical protein